MWVVASLTQSRTRLPSRRSGLPRGLHGKAAAAASPERSLVQLPPQQLPPPACQAPGSSEGLAHASWWARSSWLLSSGLLFLCCSGFLLAPGERLQLSGGASGELALHHHRVVITAQGYCSAGTPAQPVAAALATGLGEQCDVLRLQCPPVHGPAAPPRPSTATLSLCNRITEQ